MNALANLSFGFPAILLALLGLPLIWFLLRATPPAPQRTAFPPFEILRRLKRTEETPQRTPWQLLLLRLLIAMLVILGLSAPVLNAPTPSGSAHPWLVVVDDTWAAAPGWRLRTEAMNALAEEAAQADRMIYFLTTAQRIGVEPIAVFAPGEFRRMQSALAPSPFGADYATATERLAALGNRGARFDIRWFADGVDHGGASEFAARLSDLGPITVYNERRPSAIALRPADSAGAYAAVRLDARESWRGMLVARARDGRELARTPIEAAAGERSTTVTLDLPLVLRNEISDVHIVDTASAAAIQLNDARNRQSLVGFVATSAAAGDVLLSGAYYVRRALEPYAQYVSGDLDAMIDAQVSVLILDDVGKLRERDEDALRRFMEAGGVVIRFAGESLADSVLDGPQTLLPVPLRAGGRALGGALSWERPQSLGAFSADGPFADLAPGSDVQVRRQVIAVPGGETSERSWASLSDGTPLVTGTSIGRGALVLFHVTATPTWSDLPLSGLYIDMLRRLVQLSSLGPAVSIADNTALHPPVRTLDGFGVLRTPPPEARPATLADLSAGPAPNRPAGFYGTPEAPFALNIIEANSRIEPLTLPGIAVRDYGADPPLRLAPPLFILALIMLLADAVASLLFSGRLRRSAMAIAVFASAAFCYAPDHALAAPLDLAIDKKTLEAALTTRLAYVRTGDPMVDRLSQLGLTALTQEITRRTSLEPGPPDGIDPGRDELSVYPFIYWPIVPGAARPPDTTLALIETYLQFGGFIVFDTRDDERAVGGLDTPERQALRLVLGNVDLPPLKPLPADHVLLRSFYLLERLQGRVADSQVWVQAHGAANDGVTPIVIVGSDLAGAWARDDVGRPVLPLSRSGERGRELAYRSGINIVMVALTGNYKSDQVHVPALLKRLER